jgi:NAD(P)-dependent dehydrogenase (short-subunit alcohol dehydrogenase family)
MCRAEKVPAGAGIEERNTVSGRPFLQIPGPTNVPERIVRAMSRNSMEDDTMRLSGKTAIVTGGSSGIGKAVALRFAREGVRLFIGGAPADAGDLEATLVELRKTGAECAGAVVDVAEARSVATFIDAAMAHLGSVDVLVSNAGVYQAESFLDITEERWDWVLNVNLKGMFLIGQRVAREMVAQGRGGSIINTASTNALLGDEDAAHYNASKGGVVSLTKAMAMDLAVHNIRVNCVCPGMILTRMSGNMGDDPNLLATYNTRIPMDRFGTVDEVAGTYVYLASDDASYMTGASLVYDGGLTAGLRWRGWIS